MRRFLWPALLILAAFAFVLWRWDRPFDHPTGESPWNLEGRPPHLVAHYMPWFQVEKSPRDPTLTWFHWKWEECGPTRDPMHVRADGLRNISSDFYPLIGPYNSWSPRVVRYHLKTAKAIGVQAFLVDWYGPESYENQQIPLLLKEARKFGMKIALCYEEKINYEKFRDLKDPQAIEAKIIEDLTYIVTHYGHDPAYLKRLGLPFIFQFNHWDEGKALRNTSPEQWKKIFAKVPGPLVYARQNFDRHYHPLMQGAYLWWTPDTDVLKEFPSEAEEARKNGKLQFYMSMICPGFDDTGVWGWGSGPRKTERYGLSVLRDTFDRAFKFHPELIQIVTWNDFEEGTAIEPSWEHGFWYLDAIETWWGKMTGRKIDLDDIRRPYQEYLKECSEFEWSMLPAPWMVKRSLMVERPNVLESARKQAEAQSALTNQ